MVLFALLPWIERRRAARQAGVIAVTAGSHMALQSDETSG